MSLKLNSSGGGSVTLQEPSTASNLTLTLPAATGTAVIQDASNNLLMNSGYGSDAVAYGCRAWVNFKGTSTVTIRGSGNVSSVTDNGTGDFTVNFTTAFPDVNYGASGLAEGGSAGDAAITIEKASILQTVSTMRVYVKQGSTVTDRDYNFLSFFR